MSTPPTPARTGWESTRVRTKSRHTATISARAPTTPRQRHYCGLFWSATTGRHVAYESRLELDRLWLADFDVHVDRIAAQPVWLVGRNGSALRRHVPDLLLRDRNGTITLVDVKPERLVSRREVSEVFRWTSRLCAAKGWRYEVWSGRDLVVLDNIRLLGSARRRQFLDDDAVDAVTAAANPGRQLGEVLRHVAGQVPHVLARPALLWLLWSGTWTTDLTVVLSRASVLGPPGDGPDASAACRWARGDGERRRAWRRHSAVARRRGLDGAGPDSPGRGPAHRPGARDPARPG